MVSRLLLVATLMMTCACAPADQTILTPTFEPGAPVALLGAPQKPARTSKTASEDDDAGAPSLPLAGSLAAYARLEAGLQDIAMADPTASPKDARLAEKPLNAPSALAAAAPAESGPATGETEPRPAGQRWRAAYPHVVTSCFPKSLRAALNQIAEHFDSEVLVTSGERQRGRRGSMHRSCQAADIRVAGVSPEKIAAYARKVPDLKGVGTYRWVSVTHVDVRREAFTWRW